MIKGELTTMGLPDLLQWADAGRAKGVLRLERDGDVTWLAVDNRRVIATSVAPNRPVSVPDVVPQGLPENTGLSEVALATEHLYDQFLDPCGSFTFERDAALPPNGIELDMAIGELLMESMRLLDEWNRIDVDYSNDSSRLIDLEPESEASLSVVQRAVLGCAKARLSISQARLHLGLSRPSILRRVDELRALGHVRVDGVPGGEDLGARLLIQAKQLLEARQFDEAAHVFGALLTADPSATHVRRMLGEAEREHLEYLRARLPAGEIPRRTPKNIESGLLTSSERAVLDQVNGRWDVGIIVLTSPLRETETLKSLQKLRRLGVVAFTSTAA